MSLSIRPLHPHFVGEVAGVDLRRPLSREEVAALQAGIDRHAVLVFRDQDLTDEQQVTFSRNFGDLERPDAASNITRPEDRRLSADLADISNLDRGARILGRDDRQRLFNLANRLWHSDSSFRVVPASFSLLSARVVPTRGGNTEFAPMCAAYEALDDATRAEIEDLVCEHSLLHSRGLLGFSEFSDSERANFKPVRQRLVRSHPATGRKSLFLSSHAGTIVGWPVPEARSFLRDLTEAATRREFVYSHPWRTHDLVMWDNRQTLHRARPFNDASEVRDMRRTTVAGDAPTVSQAA